MSITPASIQNVLQAGLLLFVYRGGIRVVSHVIELRRWEVRQMRRYAWSSETTVQSGTITVGCGSRYSQIRQYASCCW
jgi:hypothetical protein